MVLIAPWIACEWSEFVKTIKNKTFSVNYSCLTLDIIRFRCLLKKEKISKTLSYWQLGLSVPI